MASEMKHCVVCGSAEVVVLQGHIHVSKRLNRCGILYAAWCSLNGKCKTGEEVEELPCEGCAGELQLITKRWRSKGLKFNY